MIQCTFMKHNMIYHCITRYSLFLFLFGLGGVFLVRMELLAWCSGGWRPLIAGCLSLQRLGVDFSFFPLSFFFFYMSF